MKRGIRSILSVALTFSLSACASTFVASKDGKGFYLGNSSNAAYQMFCETGDLKRILAGTTFAQDLKDSLYQYNCGPERSHEKIKQVFASMTPVERKGLRQSFKNNGYDINIMRC